MSNFFDAFPVPAGVARWQWQVAPLPGWQSYKARFGGVIALAAAGAFAILVLAVGWGIRHGAPAPIHQPKSSAIASNGVPTGAGPSGSHPTAGGGPSSGPTSSGHGGPSGSTTSPPGGGTPGPTSGPPPPSTDPAVTYQIDALHDGAQSSDGLTGNPLQQWTVDLGGSVGYPLIAQGDVYVAVANASSGSKLYALKQSNGQTAWGPIDLGGTYRWSAIAYDSGTIFSVNTDGFMRSFNAATGVGGWSVQLPGQSSFSSAPTAINGVVYTGGAGSGGTVYAVSEASGAVLWTASVQNGDHSSPAVTASGVFVSYACEQTYDLSPASGAVIWHHSTGCSGGGGRTAVVHGSSVYVRDDAGMGPAVLDAANGTVTGAFSSTVAPAFDNERMFTLQGSTLAATALVNGSTTWSFTGDNALVSAPVAVNGTVIVASSNGQLYAISQSSGAVAWQRTLPTGASAPDEHNVSGPLTGLAVGNGSLLVPAGTTLTAYH